MDVKLMFEMKDGWGERMWVTVTTVKRRKLIGRLNNLSVGIPRLMPGGKIKFKHEHIIGIWYNDADPAITGPDEDPCQSGTHLVHDGRNRHAKNQDVADLHQM